MVTLKLTIIKIIMVHILPEEILWVNSGQKSKI